MRPCAGRSVLDLPLSGAGCRIEGGLFSTSLYLLPARTGAGWQTILGLFLAIGTEWFCYGGSECYTAVQWFEEAFFTDRKAFVYHGVTLLYILAV